MERQSETKQLATQGIILVVASFAVRFIGFFYRIPLTNLWGDEGNDAYSMAYQIYNLCIIISSFGVPATISRMVGKRLALKQYANALRVVRVAMILVGSITLVCAGFLWFGNRFIAEKFFGQPAAALAIRVQAPTLVVVCCLAVLRGLFQGMNNMKPTAISQVFEQIVNAATSLLFAFMLFGKGLEQGVAGGISGALFGGLVALAFLLFVFFLYKQYSWIGSRKAKPRYLTESDSSIAKEMLLLLVPIVLAASVMNIKSIIDSGLFIRLMKLKGYGSEAGIMRGIYQGKFVLLTTLPIAVGNAMGTASVPSITRSITLNERREVHKKIRMQFKLIFLISLPSAVGMAVIARPLLHLLYPAAPEGGELFWVGSVQIVFYSLVHVSTGILQGIDKVNLPVKNACVAAILSFAVNIFCILVLDMNIYALVINDMFFSGILAFLDMEAVLRYARMKLRLGDLLLKPLVSALLMGVICAGTYLGLHKLSGSNIIALAISILVAVIAYFVIAVNTEGITKEDMNNLPMGRRLEILKFKKP